MTRTSKGLGSASTVHQSVCHHQVQKARIDPPSKRRQHIFLFVIQRPQTQGRNLLGRSSSWRYVRRHTLLLWHLADIESLWQIVHQEVPQAFAPHPSPSPRVLYHANPGQSPPQIVHAHEIGSQRILPATESGNKATGEAPQQTDGATAQIASTSPSHERAVEAKLFTLGRRTSLIWQLFVKVCVDASHWSRLFFLHPIN